jgi:hypothetical protein
LLNRRSSLHQPAQRQVRWDDKNGIFRCQTLDGQVALPNEVRALYVQVC